MNRILFFLFAISIQPLFGQNVSLEKLLGTWKLQNIDSKKLVSGISMTLKVEPETMLISNEFDEIKSNWEFSENGKYIYYSNDKSDEDWLLIELSDTKLIIEERGVKMEFLKTEKYKKNIVEDPYDNLNKTDIIDRDKLILGDWKINKIESQDKTKDGLSLSFRPKGSMYYNFGAMPTPANWTLNNDKKSLTITAYNSISEIWVINKFSKDELILYIDKKRYFLSRK